jgi:hypothetical protein
VEVVMSGIQKLFKAILPKSMAADMEAESRSWIFQCECGNSTSIWDIGGIRWKSKGNSKAWIKCPHCGKAKMQTLSKSG